jgi:hypothetical protein
MKLNSNTKIRIVDDQVLYTGTPHELVEIFFRNQWFTNDATPELWMKGVAKRLNGRVRTTSREAFVADMIYEVGAWEILKRELSVNDKGEPMMVWPVVPMECE